MATPSDVKQLGRIAPTGDYTDAELLALVDAKTINGAAAELWAAEAKATASLVDTSESGSSRKNSQAHDKAKSMQEYYAGLYAADLVVTVDTAPKARTRVMRR
jgi:hypothetical protein